MDVGIKELRDGLSRHLAAVRAGETITVTDHGTPIARIVPVTGLSALERLEAEGLISRPERPKGPAPTPIRLRSGATVSDLVDWVRGPREDVEPEEDDR